MEDSTNTPNTVVDGPEASAENPFDKKKRKRTSKVWDEFKEITLPDGSKKAECIHCKSKLVLNKSGPTTQYNRHLQGCVTRKIALKGQQQLTIGTVTARSETVGAVQNFKYDHARMREVIAQMIMVHELPFSFVEYEWFNLAMKTATPNYERISRKMVKKDCVSSYEIEKNAIKAMLENVSRVSITTDLWRSDQNIQYMVVTCHFVDDDFVLQKRILNFVDIPPPHTGIVICDALKKCFVEWGIESKVWTVTVDNASYNDVALENLQNDLELINKLPLDGKFFHVRCCAHILNILVQCGLGEISSIIHNVRESVKYIGKSVSRLHVFSSIAHQLKLPKKKLVLDCPTRWNSTYMMLSVALEYKDVFPRYKQRDESYNFLPSEDDWKKTQVVCAFLKNYNRITKVISASESPTSNLFLTELWTTKKVLDEARNSPNNFMWEMVTKMKEKFDKYWGDANLLIAIAAILDPRTKMKFVQFIFRDIYSPFEADNYVQKVRETLNQLFMEYVEVHKLSISDKQSTCETPSVDVFNDQIIGDEGTQSYGLSVFHNYIRNEDGGVDMGKSELDIYLEDGVIIPNPTDPPFDALQWWKEHKNKYCVLSKMACHILSIPITSVASESAFSAGSRVIDPHRASLNTDTV